jgi:translation initiation factor 2B subunit (eIF-2B alpha/beta/delta family)/ADP-ribose pyrophosphatase YjhB (NUDIX family)
MSGLVETHVVTCFLRNGGDVLLLRRSDRVGSYQRRWGAVAGHVEDEPDASARREIDEESGLLQACTLVRRGEPFPVEDAELGKRWVVHPYLFDCSSRDASLDHESTEAVWAPPTEILRRDSVPRLWTSWRRVAPSVGSIAGDREHGSVWLSLRALEVLRDAAAQAQVENGNGNAEDGDAAEGGRWEELASVARDLLSARPAMTALHNRVHRAMHRAAGNAAALADEAQQVLEAAVSADDRVADAAAERIQGAHVFTLSRSGTVLAALLRADCRVTVAASYPMGEGVDLAERLASAGHAVRLCPDASAAVALHDGSVDLVLVGADAIRADGTVVNKVGTHPAALAAQAAGVPVWVAAARDKVEPGPGGGEPDTRIPEPVVARAEVYGGEAELTVVDALFESTPAERFAGIVTDEGILDAEGVQAVAAGHRTMRAWRER